MLVVINVTVGVVLVGVGWGLDAEPSNGLNVYGTLWQVRFDSDTRPSDGTRDEYTTLSISP